MPRQCEIVAVEQGAKKRYEEAKSAAYQRMQKPEPLMGIARRYEPAQDGGEELPSERQIVQVRVSELLESVSAACAELFDVVATKDSGNCIAKADVVVDGQALATDVPVTHLLWLEKQLEDLNTVIAKLPCLDPAQQWSFDANQNCYATEPVKTARNVKVKRAIVLYDATPEHPAQTQLIEEDKLAGYWTTQRFCGGLPMTRVKQLRVRVGKLQDAVRTAREKANNTPVKPVSYGKTVMDWLFAE